MVGEKGGGRTGSCVVFAFLQGTLLIKCECPDLCGGGGEQSLSRDAQELGHAGPCGRLEIDPWGCQLPKRGPQLPVSASSDHRAEGETGHHRKIPQHPGEGAATEPDGQRQAAGRGAGAERKGGG